jgi:transcription antitermination factor NusG
LSVDNLHNAYRSLLDVTSHAVDARWYAAYTTARHEKRVAENLQQKDIECYLPLYEALHRWKDRKAKVLLPLFPGYVFVRVPLRERLRVLEIPSVVHLVGRGDQPTELPEQEIESLRNGLTALCAEPCPYLKVGDRVRVKHGPLAGLECILLRKRDSCRLVLSIDIIMRSVAVEIDAADIETVR